MTNFEVGDWLDKREVIKEDKGMFLTFGWPGIRGVSKSSKIREPYNTGRHISAKVRI